LKDFNKNAHSIADRQNPGKKEYLNNKADELDNLAIEIDNYGPDELSSEPALVDEILEPIVIAVDDDTETLSNHDNENAIKASAKASNFKATLSLEEDKELDLGDLLDTANDLSNLMKGMVGRTTKVATAFDNSQLSPAASAALELDDLMKGLEKGTASSSASKRLSSLRQDKNDIFARAPQVSLEKAKTFEDVAHAVAYNIHTQSKTYKSETASGVAQELGKLASSARGGKKQDLLISAKAASAHVLALSQELTEIANRIPGKNRNEIEKKDLLMKAAQGLRNYSTHLKIMASVKAASIEESRDTDESLGVICSDMGEIISQALSTVSLVEITIFAKN